MSATAGSGAVAAVLRPSDLGVLEPPVGEDRVFAAVVSALGYTSVQTSAQLEAQRAASLGRTPGEDGDLVPLPYLNGLPIISGAAAGTVIAKLDIHTAPRTIAVQPALVDLNKRGQQRLSPALEISVRHDIARRLPMPQASFVVQETIGVPDPPMGRRAGGQQLANGFNVLPSPIAGEVPVPSVPAAPGAAYVQGVVHSAAAPFPLHHIRFAEGFSQQVSLMASDGVQHARISINPPELGRVELRIIIRNEEAAVQLASQHGAVREALEEALPRLREQFEQAGLRLGDGSVFNELPSQSTRHQDRDERFAGRASAGERLTAETVAHSAVRTQQGLIDAYV